MELNIARELANTLLKEHKIFWTGWRVEFDNAKTYFGTYNHRNKRIYLSRYLLANAGEPTARQVILHLIAHAIAGYQTTSHDDKWQDIAAQLGAASAASINGIRFCKPRQPELKPANSAVARQFIKLFGAARVVELSELRALTTFNFDHYDSKNIPTGATRAFLECKLWKSVGDNQLMKLFFLTEPGERRLVLEVWKSKFNESCLTADKETDLTKTEVGRWYEILTTKGERGTVRLQSMKRIRQVTKPAPTAAKFQ